MSGTEALARAVCAAETISPATSWEGCSEGMRERYRTFAVALAGQGVGLVDAERLEADAYRIACRRLRHLHTSLAGRRQDWANNTEQRCSAARAVAYQSAMQSVHSIIDEIEAIAAGVRRG